MISALVLAAAIWPKTMTTVLGGVDIEAREPFTLARHDARTGYFIYKTLDCDGAHRSLTLTKDRRMVAGAGYNTTRFGRKPEPHAEFKIDAKPFVARAANGISIGMSKASVLRKLGKPTKSAVRGSARQYWCAMYKKVNGSVLRNSYIFKEGKLIEMTINLDSVPGCGEDSLSDEGWPWSEF